jgi:hypothetical protein
VPDPVPKADDAPDMSIPGIAAMDRSLAVGAPDWGIGMVMPGIADGAWSDGIPIAGGD